MKSLIQKYFGKFLKDIPPEILSLIRKQLVCVEITNAARWFYEESGQEFWDPEDDFPSVVSPWPLTWFEFKNLQFISDTTGEELFPKQITGSGLLVWNYEIPEGLQSSALIVDPLPKIMMSRARPKAEGDLGDRQRWLKEARESGRQPKWIQFMRLFWELQGNRLSELIFNGAYLDEFGKVFGDLMILAPIEGELTSPAFQRLDTAAAIEFFREVGSVLFPFYFAISLMHCKNVILSDYLPPPKVRQSRMKRGFPDIIYKTLIVEPMRKQVRSEQSASGERNEIRQALHIVRGHFKDYREGPGLFGKLHGVWWWEMHARGDGSLGRVEKDYEVKGPFDHFPSQ